MNIGNGHARAVSLLLHAKQASTAVAVPVDPTLAGFHTQPVDDDAETERIRRTTEILNKKGRSHQGCGIITPSPSEIP